MFILSFQICILLLVVAATQASVVPGPWLGAGHYGAFATGTAINHVAPAAPLAYGGVYGYGAYGHGLVGAPLAYGHGALAPRYGALLGLGH